MLVIGHKLFPERGPRSEFEDVGLHVPGKALMVQVSSGPSLLTCLPTRYPRD